MQTNNLSDLLLFVFAFSFITASSNLQELPEYTVEENQSIENDQSVSSSFLRSLLAGITIGTIKGIRLFRTRRARYQHSQKQFLQRDLEKVVSMISKTARYNIRSATSRQLTFATAFDEALQSTTVGKLRQEILANKHPAFQSNLSKQDIVPNTTVLDATVMAKGQLKLFKKYQLQRLAAASIVGLVAAIAWRTGEYIRSRFFLQNTEDQTEEMDDEHETV